MDGQKTLSGTGRLRPLHLVLASSDHREEPCCVAVFARSTPTESTFVSSKALRLQHRNERKGVDEWYGHNAFFRDGERVESHMWNRLPGGAEVDLTRDQFRNGEAIGEPSVRERPVEFDREHPRYHRYEAYLVLARRVQEHLAGITSR